MWPSEHSSNRQSAIGNRQFFSLFGCVVTVARANLRFRLHALELEFDGAKLSVARFVGRIVTDAVKRADVGRNTRKRSARIRERCRLKTTTAGHAREVVHFAPRDVVKLTTDRHSFKWSHAAKAVEVFSLRRRRNQPAITLDLSLRERELAVVLAVFHQTIFDEVFGVDLHEVTRDTRLREF